MIKAIIFDCFGVLVESSYEPFKQKYLSSDKSLVARFMEIEDLSSTGKISLKEAVSEFAKLAKLSYEETNRFLLNNPKNLELLNFIKYELKSNYKIGMLSNVAANRLEELFLPEDIALFDDIILSFMVGLAKPDTRIYNLAAQRLGVRPNECLFVDDREKYVVGARAASMEAVQFKDVSRLRIGIQNIIENRDNL